jgi:transposase
MAAESERLFEDWPLEGEPRSSPAEPSAVAVGNGKPRFHTIDREQSFFTAVDVDALIEEDHPARAVWAVISQLNLQGFSEAARAVEGSAGRSTIDPCLLASLWIYAYSQGVGSAREISRLCEYHPAYRWLTGVERISGHTLSDFRVQHKTALEKLFVEVVGVLTSEGFVKLTRVMQDGTKVRAHAAADSFHRQPTLEQHLADARAQYAALSQSGENQESAPVREARLRGVRQRQERLTEAVRQVRQRVAESGAEERVSSSEPQARMMKQPDGGFAPSYNVQTTTAAEGKAIVSLEVTQAGNDFDQLAPALDRLERTLESKPEQAVVDGGYINQQNLLETATRGVELIGPIPSSDAKAAQCYERAGVQEEFYRERFRFEAAENCYYCPRGVRLSYQGKTKGGLVVLSKYQARARDCAACACKADCCPKNQKSGRSVQRSEYHQEIQAFQQRMALQEKQQIYRQRSEVAETPHLWMKAKFQLRRFHVRGLIKAGQEALWAALTYNIVLLLRYRQRVATALG